MLILCEMARAIVCTGSVIPVIDCLLLRSLKYFEYICERKGSEYRGGPGDDNHPPLTSGGKGSTAGALEHLAALLPYVLHPDWWPGSLEQYFQPWRGAAKERQQHARRRGATGLSCLCQPTTNCSEGVDGNRHKWLEDHQLAQGPMTEWWGQCAWRSLRP